MVPEELQINSLLRILLIGINLFQLMVTNQI